MMFKHSPYQPECSTILQSLVKNLWISCILDMGDAGTAYRSNRMLPNIYIV